MWSRHGFANIDKAESFISGHGHDVDQVTASPELLCSTLRQPRRTRNEIASKNDPRRMTQDNIWARALFVWEVAAKGDLAPCYLRGQGKVRPVCGGVRRVPRADCHDGLRRVCRGGAQGRALLVMHRAARILSFTFRCPARSVGGCPTR